MLSAWHARLPRQPARALSTACNVSACSYLKQHVIPIAADTPRCREKETYPSMAPTEAELHGVLAAVACQGLISADGPDSVHNHGREHGLPRRARRCSQFLLRCRC